MSSSGMHREKLWGKGHCEDRELWLLAAVAVLALNVLQKAVMQLGSMLQLDTSHEEQGFWFLQNVRNKGRKPACRGSVCAGSEADNPSMRSVGCCSPPEHPLCGSHCTKAALFEMCGHTQCRCCTKANHICSAGEGAPLYTWESHPVCIWGTAGRGGKENQQAAAGPWGSSFKHCKCSIPETVGSGGAMC